MDDRNIFSRLLRDIAVHDLSVIVLPVVVWVELLHLCTYGVIALLTALRVAAYITVLRVITRPLTRWQRAKDEASEAELRAAVLAAHRVETRFTPIYTALLLALLGTATALGPLGVLPEIQAGRAELALGLGLTLAAGVGELLMARVALSSSLRKLHDQLAHDAAAHGIGLPRRRSSLRRTLTRTIVLVNIMAVLFVTMMLGALRLDLVRDHARTRSLSAAAAAALELELDPQATLVDELELVEPDALPPVLADAAPESKIAWGVYDPATNLGLAAAPLADGRVVLARTAPAEELLYSALVLLLVLGATAVPSVVNAHHLGNELLEPLERVDAAARAFTERGSLDAAPQLHASTEDELGRLVTNFDAMLTLLTELGETAQAVACGDLRVEIEGEGALHEAFRVMLGHLRGFVTGIRQTSLELVSAAAELSATAAAQARGADEQSASMDVVNRSVMHLAETAHHIAASSTEVLTNARRVADDNEALSAEIDELRRRAAGVGELLQLIREIADRSDLLALNGSLEATRAGEAGRGFALVATEMRRLAERTAAAVTEVHTRLAEIEAAGASTVAATRTSRELALDTQRAAQAIHDATGRHEQQTREASTAVGEARARVETIASVTRQASSAADALRGHAEELMALTQRFQGG